MTRWSSRRRGTGRSNVAAMLGGRLPLLRGQAPEPAPTLLLAHRCRLRYKDTTAMHNNPSAAKLVMRAGALSKSRRGTAVVVVGPGTVSRPRARLMRNDTGAGSMEVSGGYQVIICATNIYGLHSEWRQEASSTHGARRSSCHRHHLLHCASLAITGGIGQGSISSAKGRGLSA